jgi:protein O-GlcNAc transferase
MRLTLNQALATAIDHHQAGRWVEASQLYRHILVEDPDHPDALHLLGLLARRAGDERLASQLIQKAISIRPGHPEYHNSLGIGLMNLAKPGEAAVAFRQAIRHAPDLAEAHYNLGNALRQLEDLSGAIEAFQLTVQLRPEIALAHAQLGELLCGQGEIEAGITALQHSLQLAPDKIETLMHLGNALASRGKLVEAESAFGRITGIRPDSPAGWTNLGNILRIQARLDEALRAYQRAIDIDPNFSAAYTNMGNALKDQGLIEEALVAFEKAVRLNPDAPEIHSNLVYATCFSPHCNALQLLNTARCWADRFERPLLASHRPFAIDVKAVRPLKVGYVSMDFRNHVVGRNVLPVLENHDRRQFEIHCFSLVPVPDALTQRFVLAADRWHECAALDAASLAEKIRSERIDILIDLSLHMEGHRLLTFARKPAPVQVTWVGYPGTTGLTSIDYRLTDPYLDPPGTCDEFYSEQSVRLPNSFWCYRPIEQSPEVSPLPAIAAGYITFGCLNNFAKVSGITLRLWARLLAKTPISRLLILCPSTTARNNTLNVFQTYNIANQRIEFVDMTTPQEHMYRYHRIDLSLDPLGYTGHTSTLDSLWMGVPVVTLPGNTSVSRGSVTALSNVGLTDLIADDAERYVQIASAVSVDVPRLEMLRSQLRPRMRASPLCDEKTFTRELESAYHLMWKDFAERRPS